MTPAPRHISVETRADVWIAHMRNFHMLEPELIEMADEVVSLIEDDGCRKLVFCLGPGDVACLYSIFLAKLVMIRRHLLERGGLLRISQASENTKNVFRACDLDKIFTFVPELDAAIADLAHLQPS
jgi:hypothetical protein